MSSDVQSLEVSYFLQMTEDRGKVSEAVASLLGGDWPAEQEMVEGHFGNKIIWVRHRLTGEEAESAGMRVISRLSEAERRLILAELPAVVDEHGALYIRLNKQALVKGDAILGSSDPVRVRLKPRPHRVRGDREGFYGRLFKEASGA